MNECFYLLQNTNIHLDNILAIIFQKTINLLRTVASICSCRKLIAKVVLE